MVKERGAEMVRVDEASPCLRERSSHPPLHPAVVRVCCHLHLTAPKPLNAPSALKGLLAMVFVRMSRIDRSYSKARETVMAWDIVMEVEEIAEADVTDEWAAAASAAAVESEVVVGSVKVVG